MTLEQFIQEEEEETVEQFKQWWIEQHILDKENSFPLEMNLEEWAEQLLLFK